MATPNVTPQQTPITISRRAFLALTLGAGAALLGGCRAARAGAAPAVPAIESPRRVTPGVRAAQPSEAGRSIQTITVGGVARRYIRYAPAGLDAAAPVPLVLVLHGRGSNGTQAERLYGMSRLADAHGFVVAYPDALGDPPQWASGFGSLTGRTDDVGFLRALVEEESAARPLDPGRVFACGHSSGAMMSYRLAGECADTFAAAGIVAGSVGFRLPSGGTVTIPKPSRPVSIVHIHGTADPLIPYNGGGQRGPAGFMSVAESVAFWVAQDGCDPTPVSTEAIGKARRETYASGRDGTEVTLWTVQDGGHEWPGWNGNVGRADISATSLIWDLFSRHPRSA